MKRKMLGMFLATVLMFGAFDVTYGASIENTVTAQSTLLKVESVEIM